MIKYNLYILLGVFITLLGLLLLDTVIQNPKYDNVLHTILVVVTMVGIFFVATSFKRSHICKEELDATRTELEMTESRLHGMWDQKQKSEFVSLASHQLRGPLTAIKGYASMVLEGSFGEIPIGVQEAVGRVLKASISLANTVEDFLNVSRIEEGGMDYTMDELDICKLIESIVDEQMFIAKEKGISMVFNERESSCTLIGDSNKIRQVINNVIDNAIKYTPKGAVTVSLKKYQDKNAILISVTDTGIGMSHSTLKHLFSKYNRGVNANEINVMGSGLGLYVARLLLEAHGGSIRATSKGENLGSTFYIELPMDANEARPLKKA